VSEARVTVARGPAVVNDVVVTGHLAGDDGSLHYALRGVTLIYAWAPTEARRAAT